MGSERWFSTDDYQITGDLAAKTQDKLITWAVFIDLRKAFDTVNHKILISKLHNYGIRGIVGRLLEIYAAVMDGLVWILWYPIKSPSWFC